MKICIMGRDAIRKLAIEVGMYPELNPLVTLGIPHYKWDLVTTPVDTYTDTIGHCAFDTKFWPCYKVPTDKLSRGYWYVPTVFCVEVQEVEGES